MTVSVAPSSSREKERNVTLTFKVQGSSMSKIYTTIAIYIKVKVKSMKPNCSGVLGSRQGSWSHSSTTECKALATVAMELYGEITPLALVYPLFTPNIVMPFLLPLSPPRTRLCPLFGSSRYPVHIHITNQPKRLIHHQSTPHADNFREGGMVEEAGVDT